MSLFYSIGIIALFFYSFTQVDLSLTLSKASWVQDFQKAFQYIGYFNRPVAAYLFVGIVFFLFTAYFLLLKHIAHFSKKQIWGLILISGVVLGLSYNAFSYDLFNYIFDAKIFTYYQQNPYEYKALDFAAVQEPMLSFMRWTHRTYPYGPVWLGISIPLSYLGFQYFLVTFFLFKALMVAAFFGTVFLLQKIVSLTKTTDEKRAIAFFALNPFVLIESVVSAHVDIVMIFFMMLGVYFLVKRAYLFAVIGFLLFYGIKFAAAEYMLPIHAGVVFSIALGVFIFSKIQQKLSWEKWFLVFGMLMIVPVVLASLRSNFQPWYVLSILPFVALLSKKISLWVPVAVFTFCILFSYVPYLYVGNWDPPIPDILTYIVIGSIVLMSILSGVLYKKETSS